MAKRTSRSLKANEENILNKLKEVIEYNGDVVNNPESYGNTWIMALAVRPFTHNQKQLLPACLEEHEVLHPEQAFFVRMIIRTTHRNGTNRYVDGTNLCVTIDQDTGIVDIAKEDEALSDSPVFHGGEIADALRWVNELADPYYIALEDPFLTPEQRLLFMQSAKEDDPFTL
ncbi:hypothetical protein [Paenibacillus polymyxa]|uniref:M1-370 n=1 Tax=Paenibacillus polymyxa (strain SC2) TaxID=886882 RepID=E3EC77_PAEPS|nr:hypothetical protein [Paenibacillus polymyxa]ADO54220.1 M1-370 [Paenibacillus polymyxa SC2]WPQ57142.1 hypothetical protein SKN87_01185 [Paenibacillus polymyxa]CCC83150.1 hypothetical protein PPM_0213 [Paenibacillus polymyxa M1]